MDVKTKWKFRNHIKWGIQHGRHDKRSGWSSSCADDSLRVVVHGVVAHKQRGVEGFGQQGVDGDHQQQHGQLQHRVEPQEHGAGDHGQDAREHEVLRDKQTSV